MKNNMQRYETNFLINIKSTDLHRDTFLVRQQNTSLNHRLTLGQRSEKHILNTIV